jgi:transposase InsO family protein
VVVFWRWRCSVRDEGEELTVFRWIEAWYNPRRRHSGIGRISSVNFETRHLRNPATESVNLSGLPG